MTYVNRRKGSLLLAGKWQVEVGRPAGLVAAFPVSTCWSTRKLCESKKYLVNKAVPPPIDSLLEEKPLSEYPCIWITSNSSLVSQCSVRQMMSMSLSATKASISSVFLLNELVFGHPGKSHYDVFEDMFRALAERGHKLTILSHVNSPHHENIRHILFRDSEPLLHDVSITESRGKGFTYMVDQLNMLSRFGSRNCKRDLQSPQFQSFLKEEHEYDLIIGEMFNTVCYDGLATKYNVPFIGLYEGPAELLGLKVFLVDRLIGTGFGSGILGLGLKTWWFWFPKNFKICKRSWRSVVRMQLHCERLRWKSWSKISFIILKRLIKMVESLKFMWIAKRCFMRSEYRQLKGITGQLVIGFKNRLTCNPLEEPNNSTLATVERDEFLHLLHSQFSICFLSQKVHLPEVDGIECRFASSDFISKIISIISRSSNGIDSLSGALEPLHKTSELIPTMSNSIYAKRTIGYESSIDVLSKSSKYSDTFIFTSMSDAYRAEFCMIVLATPNSKIDLKKMNYRGFATANKSQKLTRAIKGII
ncbi:hypothetical protein HUJ05_001725 [Dendroctonus ponderosae]|nr:hypothetical protein HUJ05_001725 [Dendroctonus ponderosae]